MTKLFLYILIPALHVVVPSSGTAIYTQHVTGARAAYTTITINDLEHQAAVNPMIYGQMLEDCNDNVVYGGVVNKDGQENNAVTNWLKQLNVPVVRWPAGTAIYDYEWQRGIGPTRTAQAEKIWGGTEYYTFGTDEFINWCRKIGAEPYINVPMGNNNTYTHSLGEALDWIEYVNGAPDSPMGAYRARNGHEKPYDVKYWCLGNENYLGNRFHKSEDTATYAQLLRKYASTIKGIFPDVRLLGVGRSGGWNTTVLTTSGEYLDYLTLHYYLTAKVGSQALVSPVVTLMGPERVEANLRLLIDELERYNTSVGRTDNPVRLSIDEWNCRHSVSNAGRYSFTRKDDRRLYDAAAVASMLNVFIHTSPHVAMANYIFPVNGHGLLKTVGEQDAYPSACYHVFDLYRRFMVGGAVGVSVRGPGITELHAGGLSVDGDNESTVSNSKLNICYIGSAAVIDGEGRLMVSLVNRSYDEKQKVKLSVPAGYKVTDAWTVTHADVCAKNTAEERDNVTTAKLPVKSATLTLAPCAIAIIVMTK